MLHVFFSTLGYSPPNIRCGLSREGALERIDQMVRYARNAVPNVEWSAMDATRTDLDYLCRAAEAAVRAGATTINPARYGRLHPAARVRADVQHRARLAERAGAERRAGRPQRAQPRTTSAWATANTIAAIEGRGAADRGDDQRHRRARREYPPRRGGDGPADPRRQIMAATRPVSAPSGSGPSPRSPRAAPDRGRAEQSDRRGPTPSRTSPASTRTALSRIAPPTRS